MVKVILSFIESGADLSKSGYHQYLGNEGLNLSDTDRAYLRDYLCFAGVGRLGGRRKSRGKVVEKMEGVSLVGEDFTQGVPRLYDRIFANPPFAKNQDIRHVRMMYDALNPDGGEMCVITSTHWRNAPEKECASFREWLHEVEAETHEIPEGVFRESGTDVATMAIVIRRNTGGGEP